MLAAAPCGVPDITFFAVELTAPCIFLFVAKNISIPHHTSNTPTATIPTRFHRYTLDSLLRKSLTPVTVVVVVSAEGSCCKVSRLRPLLARNYIKYTN